MQSVSITNITRRGRVPRFTYTVIKERVLPGWEISLVFVDPAQARALNKRMRGKTYVPNVLSYALDKRSGEIVICLTEAKKQAASYFMDERTFILYLFIHGILHIKGWAHGARMEACERNLLAKFLPNRQAGAEKSVRAYLTNETTHSNRHRHRDVPSKNGRHRGSHR